MGIQWGEAMEAAVLTIENYRYQQYWLLEILQKALAPLGIGLVLPSFPLVFYFPL